MFELSRAEPPVLVTFAEQLMLQPRLLLLLHTALPHLHATRPYSSRRLWKHFAGLST